MSLSSPKNYFRLLHNKVCIEDQHITDSESNSIKTSHYDVCAVFLEIKYMLRVNGLRRPEDYFYLIKEKDSMPPSAL